MSLSFDPMTKADYDQVLAVWLSAEGLSHLESREDFERFIDRNPGLSVVARDTETDQIIGAVWCGHDGRRGYLYHVAVAGGFRRQGIGTDMVTQCLKNLENLGIKRCTLFIFVTNEAAEKFWKAIGWRERVDLKLMAKDIGA
jgi:ribosomal protein S18 acetylase RimI-like enzyme